MVTEHRLSSLISSWLPRIWSGEKVLQHTHMYGSSHVHVCPHKNLKKWVPSDSNWQPPILFPTIFISDAQRHPFPLYQNVWNLFKEVLVAQHKRLSGMKHVTAESHDCGSESDWVCKQQLSVVTVQPRPLLSYPLPPDSGQNSSHALPSGCTIPWARWISPSAFKLKKEAKFIFPFLPC